MNLRNMTLDRKWLTYLNKAEDKGKKNLKLKPYRLSMSTEVLNSDICIYNGFKP